MPGELERFEEPREVETFLPLADGSRRTVLVNGAPLGTEEPLTDYRLVTLTDVTPIRKAEEDMRAQYRYITEISNTVIEQALDLKHYSARLEEKVRERTRQLHEAHLEAIYMLAVASEAKDEDTGHHVRRIQKYAHALARKLGMPEPDAEAIGYASILHDVGKFHVPDAILQKPGPLTPEERTRMQGAHDQRRADHRRQRLLHPCQTNRPKPPRELGWLGLSRPERRRRRSAGGANRSRRRCLRRPDEQTLLQSRLVGRAGDRGAEKGVGANVRAGTG